MKTAIFSYIPFQHNNFDYIKGVIKIARDQKIDTIEGVLTSTLIYMNAIDYISAHLMENLVEIDCLITNYELGGVVFRNDYVRKNVELGKIIDELDRYDFPDKKYFLDDLKIFKNKRNKIAHRLLSLTQKELDGEIDEDLKILRSTAEELLAKYDIIVKGVSGSWGNYIQKVIAIQDKQTINNEESPTSKK